MKNTWTIEQERFLREKLDAMTLKDLGAHCGRGTATVASKLRSMGLKKDVDAYDYRNKFPKTWTVEQEQFLRIHKDDMTLKELRRDCGNRSIYTIAAKLRSMGVKKTSFSCRTFIREGERLSRSTEFKRKLLTRAAIYELYPQYPMVVVAEKLGVAFQTLDKEFKRLHVERKNKSYYLKGRPKPKSRERMLHLWRSGYFATKFYPFAAPNLAEDKLLAVIQELELPFKYVGDWKYQVGTKNPDFVHLSKPVCIDLFGEYWHSARNKHNTSASYQDPAIRSSEFESNGHRLLVIYEKELRDLDSLRTKLVEYAEA